MPDVDQSRQSRQSRQSKQSKQSRPEKNTVVDQLDQIAKTFKVVTDLWVERHEPGKAVTTNENQNDFPANQRFELVELDLDQKMADLSTEELARLRIQLAKDFLRALDDKLSRERETHNQFKARTLFD